MSETSAETKIKVDSTGELSEVAAAVEVTARRRGLALIAGRLKLLSGAVALPDQR